MEIVFINSKVIKWFECITKVAQWVLFLEASEIVLHPAGLLLKEKSGIYKANVSRNKVGKTLVAKMCFLVVLKPFLDFC